MMKTALLFPGQGSQTVGMGRDLVDLYAPAREVYAQADKVLGFSLSDICFEGPAERLNETINTQPALFVTSLAILRSLEASGQLLKPAMVAGHSLGELTALVAAGVLSFADGLRLVRERGRLMTLAGERNPGGMAAVIKMDNSDVEQACKQASAETGQVVQIANYNSPGQVVISGHKDALDRATVLLRERGGRRIVPLAVSIAAHSPLMTSVIQEYRAAIDATPLQPPQTTIVGNIGARPLLSVDEIRDELAAQLTWPVRWTSSIQWMVDQEITHFVELGPKDILNKLVRRTARQVEAVSLGDSATVQAYIAQEASQPTA